MFMRDHPGHWICLSGNAMGDGPTSVNKDVWHRRLVEAADQHHAFWTRLPETAPPAAGDLHPLRPQSVHCRCSLEHLGAFV